MILMLISTCVVLAIGTALGSLNNEIKNLEHYMEIAEDIKPNFEESLSLYTETTKGAIEYIHSIRPEGEIEYIEFISSIEEIGQNLFLDLSLQSIEGSVDTDVSPSIEYEVDFYGSSNDLTNFLEELEELDYYVHVVAVDYTRIAYTLETQDLSPNISINLKLYVK